MPSAVDVNDPLRGPFPLCPEFSQDRHREVIVTGKSVTDLDHRLKIF